MTYPWLILASPYDVLDIETSAKPEDIKKKYRQLSLCMRYFSSDLAHRSHPLTPSHPPR